MSAPLHSVVIMTDHTLRQLRLAHASLLRRRAIARDELARLDEMEADVQLAMTGDASAMTRALGQPSSGTRLARPSDLGEGEDQSVANTVPPSRPLRGRK